MTPAIGQIVDADLSGYFDSIPHSDLLKSVARRIVDVQRICAEISDLAGRNHTQLEQEQIVARLNRTMIGWANYFCLGPASKAYRAVERHACKRLRRWLYAKHQRQGAGARRYSDESLYIEFGLVRLTSRTASFPWATP